MEEIIKNLKDQTVVVFSKKGYFYNKISNLDLRIFFIYRKQKLK